MDVFVQWAMADQADDASHLRGTAPSEPATSKPPSTVPAPLPSTPVIPATRHTPTALAASTFIPSQPSAA